VAAIAAPVKLIPLDRELLAACYDGNTSTAERLIEQGANVNVFNDLGTTPLIRSGKKIHTHIHTLNRAGSAQRFVYMHTHIHTARQSKRDQNELTKCFRTAH